MKLAPKLLAAYLLAATCVSGADETTLVFATGSEKGKYFELGTSIAENAKQAKLRIEVLSTQGSHENLVMLSQGAAQLCIAQSDVVHEALTGSGFFAEPLNNIQAIMPLYTEVVHIFVRNPLHLTNIHDLRGKRIAVGPKGSGTESNAQLILESAGIAIREVELVNLSFDEAVSAIAKSQIDVVFYTSGFPSRAATTILQESYATLFELSPDLLERLVNSNPYFILTSIPATAYPNQNENVASLGVPAILLVNSNVKQTLVYSFTKSVFASGKYDPFSAREALSFPVSRGANRYYEERGVYRRQHSVEVWMRWVLPPLVTAFVLFLVLKFKIIGRFVRLKDFARVSLSLSALFVAGACVMYFAERKVNDNYGTPQMAAWSTLENWINFGSKEPITSTGRTTSIVMTLLGFGGVVWLMAETATIFLRKALTGAKKMHNNHYVIINWNKKGPGIVEQLLTGEVTKRNIVILTQKHGGLGYSIPEREEITHIASETITEGLLKRGNLLRAHSIVILAEDRDDAGVADAENVLIMLTIKKLCRGGELVPIVAEMLDPRRADLAQCAGLLEDGQIEIVSTQKLGQNLLAQVAVTPGLSRIYEDLLTFGANTNEIYSRPIPKCLVGKPIDALLVSIVKLRQENTEIAPVAISRRGKMLLNPSSAKYGNVEEGDALFAICDNIGALDFLERLTL